MKVAIIGSGYVGLVAGVCFAYSGQEVICVDRDEDKIRMLKNGQIPIYEPGLAELLAACKSRIRFTTDLSAAVNECKLIFSAVGTPEKEDGSADLSMTMGVVGDISRCANGDKFIVLKSTVPVGTAKMAQDICNKVAKHRIEMISNPEFLREGSALEDFLHPDRVVIGCQSDAAQEIMTELYAPFFKDNPKGPNIFAMDNVSAELTKYAANSFLSVKISFINELAMLADKTGADIDQVRRGFTSDNRINPKFFSPGVGFGGSCFPKDVKALMHVGQKHDIAMQVVTAADEVNDRQKTMMVGKIKAHFGDLRGKKIAIWGLAFKAETDDVREAPASYLIAGLQSLGAKIVAYDPIAMGNAQRLFPTKFDVAKTALEATHGADALVVVTEWKEFREFNMMEVKSHLKTPVVFDGRNLYDPKKMVQQGFDYYCVGRDVVAHSAKAAGSNSHKKAA